MHRRLQDLQAGTRPAENRFPTLMDFYFSRACTRAKCSMSFLIFATICRTCHHHNGVVHYLHNQQNCWLQATCLWGATLVEYDSPKEEQKFCLLECDLMSPSVTLSIIFLGAKRRHSLCSSRKCNLVRKKDSHSFRIYNAPKLIFRHRSKKCISPLSYFLFLSSFYIPPRLSSR